MKHWASTHRRALAEALHRFTAAPFASLLNVAVIGIALALPMAFYVLLDNARQLAREHAPQPELSLFLAGEAGTAHGCLVQLEPLDHRPHGSIENMDPFPNPAGEFIVPVVAS